MARLPVGLRRVLRLAAVVALVGHVCAFGGWRWRFVGLGACYAAGGGGWLLWFTCLLSLALRQSLAEAHSMRARFARGLLTFFCFSSTHRDAQVQKSMMV